MNNILVKGITFFGAILMLFLTSCGNGSDTDVIEVQTNTSQNAEEGFTDEFDLETRTLSTSGRNPFFILEPGYVLEFSGEEEGNFLSLLITVLDDTMKVGSLWTRVVEEREMENGELVEISRNYFAIDRNTQDVFYFGEEVDIYEEGRVTSHSGAWVAKGENHPGLIMPGSPLVGARYYQEIAPGIAMDRAEVKSTDESFTCPAGEFDHVLKMVETSPLEPGSTSVKLYAPEVGLVMDGELSLVSYGMVR